MNTTYKNGVYKYTPKQFLDITGDFAPLSNTDTITINNNEVIINNDVHGFCLAEAVICGDIGELIHEHHA